jgi:hypothetical protein
LQPAERADLELLRRVLIDLHGDRFIDRKKAQSDLEELGELAEPALRKSLADNQSLEFRMRLQQVLDSVRTPVTRPERIRPLRAVAVLEDIGTGAAQALLRELAEGTPEARLTREARASLERLERKHLGSR